MKKERNGPKANTDNKDHSHRSHSILGGSTAERWVNCPGSVLISKGIPEGEAGEAAKLGTRAHEIAEKFLGTFLHHKVTGEHGNFFPSIDAETDEIYEHVKEYTQAIWEKVLLGSVTSKGYGLETEFSFHDDYQMYGHVDFWSVYIDRKGKRAGVVVDFKYGFVHVPVEKNLQLIYYAIALQNYCKSKGKPLESIRTVIYQARHDDPYREAKYTAAQLEKYEKKFLKAAHTILIEKKQKFKVGDWCTFCPAKSVCPTFIKDIETKTSLKIVDPDEVTLPVPATLPPEKLAKIVLYANVLEKFLKSCKSYVYQQAARGNKIPGLKVIETAGRRAWIKDESKIEKTFARYGITDIYQKKLKPLTSLEKQLKRPEILAELVNKGSKLSIVEESDQRPEVRNFQGLLDSDEEE